MKKRRVDSRLIAALGTLLFSVALIAALLFNGLSWSSDALSDNRRSEEPEEEYFLEPEILVEGEDEPEAPELPDVKEQTQAAKQGLPDKAPEEQRQVEIPSESPKPAPKVEKPLTQTKPSPVKATTPPKSDKPEKRATDPTAGKFSSDRNGSKKTTGNNTGTASSGVGITHNLQGRRFLGCDKPQVLANQRVVVTVSITVNAQGNVVTARARGGDSAQRRACERAAKTARWSEKAGAGEAVGTLTFTITPKL